MNDAANYLQQESLRDGTVVTVRAIRADDKHRIVEAFENLDTRSIFTRFFHHKQDLSATELEEATEVDFDKVVALVVTIGANDNETIIAGGRYFAFDADSHQRHAEVAFTVEEDYHGQGIASRLLRHLAYIARQKGIAQFEADVLPQNQAMIKVFSRSGLGMNKAIEVGNIHVTLSLINR